MGVSAIQRLSAPHWTSSYRLSLSLLLSRSSFLFLSLLLNPVLPQSFISNTHFVLHFEKLRRLSSIDPY
uniref:14-3-3 family protein n=1 Tax=Rhizophora mucronata TaxID=61149 RepID=A0A2P2KCL0_RHIMU